MQLSQLEKAVFTSLTCPTISRGARLEARLLLIDPQTPPLRLRAMATSTEGILGAQLVFAPGQIGSVDEVENEVSDREVEGSFGSRSGVE